MNSVRAIQQLNKRELEAGITPEGSWHTDYRDTAFVYIGGLPFELSEGDIITICSQFGEPVWIKLARDKETGKSRGFAWIKYEDQRSCDLAVDNLGGSTIMDRIIRVDHARYKPKDDEDMRDNTMGELDLDPDESDGGRRKRRKTESDSEDDIPLLPEQLELERLMEKLDEEDPMRDYMIKAQQEKVGEALKKFKRNQRKEKDKERRKHKHRHRDRSRDDERDRSKRTIKDARDADADKHSERHTRRRRSRSRSQDAHSDEDRRKRDRSRERRHRHKDTRDRDVRDRHRARERRSPSSVDEDEDEERPRSKRSPLPYRARSPRRPREASRSRTPPSKPDARRSRS